MADGALSETIDFADLFAHLPSPYMILDSELRFIGANAAYLAITGRSYAEIAGRFVFEAFPEEPERRALFENAFRRGVAGEANTLSRQRFDIARSPAEGGGLKQVIWTTHQIPVRDKAGAVIGVLQKALDVTAEVEAEQSRDAVLREFDHRLKNLLAKVSAISELTAREEGDLAAYLVKLRARLAALGRTQSLLLRSNERARIADLLSAELEPFGEAGRVATVSGPDIELSGTAAQTLGMAFHELSTNAAKYGSLSRDGASLAVTWTGSEDGRSVVLDWIEAGYSAETPATRGFGSTIIERLVPMDTGGQVERWFDGDGHRVRFVLPLESLAAG